MKKIDIAKSIIKNNGGIAKTAQLNEVGIQNSNGNIRGKDDSYILGRKIENKSRINRVQRNLKLGGNKDMKVT